VRPGIRCPDGDVHAKFADVVKRLFALQAVAVVVQLDRAQRLVLGELVAAHDFDEAVEIFVPGIFDEIVDSAFHCLKYTAFSEVKAAGRG
jgi:hypothetical protein